MKTQTRDANAPVETETRDAQRSRDFFLCVCFFFVAVVFFFVFFLSFSVLSSSPQLIVKSFFSLVVDLFVVGLTHKSLLFRFVSFRFFFFAPDEKDDDQKETQKESMR